MTKPSDTPTSIHETAAAGYAVGADTYVKGRPEYPAGLLDWLRTEAGIGDGTSVVDLGAGTGKFTRLLIASGASVIAVEPVPEMLERLESSNPAAKGLLGTATHIPLPDASQDAVVCAQAFHWFASRDALTEIARVLKPGGRLALVWNLRDAQVPWVARMDAIVDRHEGDVPRFYKGTWRDAFPHPSFTALKERQFANAHVGSADDVIVKRALSTSFISALPDDERQRVARSLHDLIAAEPALQQAMVSVPYRTFAFCCTKRE
jgi:SAM-dependent methyltransferase